LTLRRWVLAGRVKSEKVGRKHLFRRNTLRCDADGDSLFLNTHDNVISQLFRNKIILPNREAKGNYKGENGMPIYTVRAILDTKKRTLFYRYIHI